MNERRNFVGSLMALLSLGGCAVIAQEVLKLVNVDIKEEREGRDAIVRIYLSSVAGSPYPFRTTIDIRPTPSDPLFSDPVIDVRDLALAKVENRNPDPSVGPETVTRVRVPIGTRPKGPALMKAHAHSGHARRVIVEC